MSEQVFFTQYPPPPKPGEERIDWEYVEGLGYREHSHASPGEGYSYWPGAGWRRWKKHVTKRTTPLS